MQLTALLSAAAIGSATAFVAPTPLMTKATAVRSSSGATTTMMAGEMSKALPFMPKPSKLDGSMAGDVGFDPFGLSEIDDVGLDLYWMREAELKHGRVAMLAVTGIVWCDQVGSFPGMPQGTSQMDLFWQVWAEKPAIIGAGLVAITMIEIITGIAITKGRESGDRAPGDFGLDPYKIAGTPKMDNYALKEIKNGRLAMSAAAGLILQGCTTHESGFANLAHAFN